MSPASYPSEKPNQPSIPVEFEIFVNPDGSVTFADLEEHAIAIARELDPDCTPACDVPPRRADASPGTVE